MKEGPLTDNELQWLEALLEKYGTEHSIVDVAELDGLLTAVLSGPVPVEPETWLVAIWGGTDNVPRWANDREMNRFIDLCFQHLNDIADRLADYPEQFDPLFGTREVEGHEFTVVEEWCFGYLRGVAMTDWSGLPEQLQPELAAIRLHGDEANFARLDGFTVAQIEQSIAAIRPAALALHDYWLSRPESVPAPLQPQINDGKVGRNDLCPCGSGKKYKQCCLH